MSKYPLSNGLGGGLFELRAGGTDIARTIYAFARGRRIYILRVFIKKTQKTPLKEITHAFNRLQELEA